MSKSRKQKWLMAFRVIVSILAIAYVVWKLAQRWEELPKLWAGGWEPWQWVALIASAILMPLNYFLEATKWRLMVKPFYPQLTQYRAVLAVLAGMAAGVFTPNRIGEYAGRILFLKKGRRVEAIVATFVDRICQLAITLVAGLLAIAAIATFSGWDLPGQMLGDPLAWTVFLLLSVLLSIFVAFLVFAPGRVAALIPSRWNRAPWIRKTRFVMQNLRWHLLGKVLALSLLRFIVFSSQYLMLLYALGYDGPIAEGYALIALIFLGKSVLPVMGIFELGARESVAILVLGGIGQSEITAIGSTFLLYLINLLLPTLLGVIALQRLPDDE